MPSAYLALDLRSAQAKLARAREHLDALQRETVAGVKQESPYAIRPSEVDPQTGWCSISLVPQKVEKPRLGAILGDLIHNCGAHSITWSRRSWTPTACS